jgi:site-specific DNA-cytosine methylase
MIVLSLFDGMSAAQQSLKELGVVVDKYYTSEIDKYAIKITQKNFPNTIQLGDVCNVSISDHVDLIIAGSPCQDVSYAHKGKGLDGERSGLFFEAIRIIKEAKAINPNVKVLIENVKMKKEYMEAMSNALSEALGERVTPHLLDSGLRSAQRRKRLYWYNWQSIEEPEDRGLVLKDILESNLESYGEMEEIFDKEFKLSRDGLCHIGNAKLSGNQTIKRVYHSEGKAPTLTTMGGGHREPKVYTGDMKFRKLTPLECTRLQTFPDGYCDGVSRTQAYKMLGNSFTVEMIKCILSPIVKEQQK